ncbi:glycosyltransferase family 9 protein [Maribacter polysaccharolyticus]|uniref:glycosyltransferase family 9 protein n=1 Tax=Maribacter polysaccharolyticus TaxID=3020831 RepID=UPI00237F033E|nr:glycosyltransferase family 9 protein [Maribacter polysaccharolyticus]MDE3742233.1 glycosyltransferase family 9 protein [Maribacter polysaccharolyticus]
MDNGKHLLVIRLSAMGDVAMTVPVIKSLLDTYPELRVTVLTKAFFTPIFKGLQRVDIHVADVGGKHKGVYGLWKLYRELKGLDIDAVADLHNVLRSNILKRYFGLTGIPFVQIDKGRKEKKALTAEKDKVFKPLKSTHQRYTEVFDRLGYPFTLPQTNFLSKRTLSEKCLGMMEGNSRKWLGIAPFAAFSGKMYPLGLMEEVVQRLNKTNKYKIVLFGGGPKEKEILEKWDHTYTDCLSVVGKLTLEEELALISNLDLMLAMDSGNAHLAALFGIPTITLWGVTHPYAGFYPYGQDLDNALLSDKDRYPLIPTSIYGNKVPEGYENVMSSIAPKAVLEKIFMLLDT